MTAAPRIGIVGRGFALGSEIRANNDPVFAYVNAHPPPNTNLFVGLTTRRVLGAGQSGVGLAVEAARAALDQARLAPGDVDMLLGSVSVGDYVAPNALAAVHAELKLPDRCRVMALNTEYTAFLDGMKLAHDLIGGGSIARALVLTSCDWTRHMDYREAICVAASDAAGAAVLAATPADDCFSLVDWDNETHADLYGALRMAARPTGPNGHGQTPATFTVPLMRLDRARGAEAVRSFGLTVPPVVVNRLLAKNGLRAQDVTLIAHQTSALIHDEWKARIRPGYFISTLTELADMVSASVPVNLAKCYDQICTDHLVLLGVGMDMHATALLYRRGAGAALRR